MQTGKKNGNEEVSALKKSGHGRRHVEIIVRDKCSDVHRDMMEPIQVINIVVKLVSR